MRLDQLARTLTDLALGSGLVGFGVCTADPFADVRSEMESRLETGRAGRVRFTYTDPAAATDVRRSFPWAERLGVGAIAYLPDAGGPGAPGPQSGRIARFATRDHYAGLRTGLGIVADRLAQAGFRAEVLVDDNRLVDRAAAVRAGVGWWGKNSMVLAPKYGPWLLLGSVVTDAALPVSVPMERDCGTCSACIPACPTGALVAPGVLDARLCLSHWAQTPGAIPLDLREPMGDRVYGCDDCLDACPPGQRLAETSRRRVGRVDLVEMLSATDEALLRAHAHFYIPARNPRYLRRNALVALGNAGGEEAVAVAAGYLDHPDWLLRLHAAWALGQLGGGEAAAALTTALGREDHPEVAAEVEDALARLE